MLSIYEINKFIDGAQKHYRIITMYIDDKDFVLPSNSSFFGSFDANLTNLSKLPYLYIRTMKYTDKKIIEHDSILDQILDDNERTINRYLNSDINLNTLKRLITIISNKNIVKLSYYMHIGLDMQESIKQYESELNRFKDKKIHYTSVTPSSKLSDEYIKLSLFYRAIGDIESVERVYKKYQSSYFIASQLYSATNLVFDEIYLSRYVNIPQNLYLDAVFNHNKTDWYSATLGNVFFKKIIQLFDRSAADFFIQRNQEFTRLFTETLYKSNGQFYENYRQSILDIDLKNLFI